MGWVVTEIESTSAAVVFDANGEISLLLPEYDDTALVPEHVLAATEIFMAANEAGSSVLAEVFVNRKPPA